MNQKSYLPVMVITKEGKKVWHIDISNMSLASLSKLRKQLVEHGEDIGVIALDRIIRKEVEGFIPDSLCYMRTHKKRCKEEKLNKKNKMKKVRRKNNDKY